jgi:hypothetical protein
VLFEVVFFLGLVCVMVGLGVFCPPSSPYGCNIAGFGLGLGDVMTLMMMNAKNRVSGGTFDFGMGLFSLSFFLWRCTGRGTGYGVQTGTGYLLVLAMAGEEIPAG